jgi:hypothetical protein
MSFGACPLPRVEHVVCPGGQRLGVQAGAPGRHVGACTTKSRPPHCFLISAKVLSTLLMFVTCCSSYRTIRRSFLAPRLVFLRLLSQHLPEIERACVFGRRLETLRDLRIAQPAILA